MNTPADPVMALQNISKDFGPVRVLHGVNLSLYPGEVHALLGENGAGKSTLMKILSGYLNASEGNIIVDKQSQTHHSSRDAEANGIVLIHQEFNLAEDLSVAANIFLGREQTKGLFLDKRSMLERARALLQELETNVDPRTPVYQLSVSEKQMVEIAKAISRDVRVLVMDEPTDVLTPTETRVLFKLIRKLKSAGVAIVFISHKLDEVEAVADRITVLRDGHVVITEDAKKLTQEQMASYMVGRELSDMYPLKNDVKNEVVFAAEGVTVAGWAHDVSFELHAGEILGFSGLVGAGRTELLEGILGLRPRQEGRIFRHKQVVQIRNLRDAANLGIAYLSEDRKGKGVLLDMPLKPNLTLLALEQFAQPFIDNQKEATALDDAVKQFDIRTPSLSIRAGNLSGGNQQKLVLAKIMQINPDIIILDEPTRGIDIGTKRDIYFFIHELTKQGKACILISSDMPEVIGLSHRVVVMRNGRVTGILQGDDINETEIVRYATGLKGSNYAASA